MTLRKYDNKLIQIIDKQGEVYEGICDYSSKDYCFHEYGKNEECLEIFNFLFFKENIKEIKCIDKFTEKYGTIEKLVVEDGIDSIDDAFESEMDDHIYRILLCIEDRGVSSNIVKLLKKLIRYNESKKIIDKAKELIERKENNEY